MLKIDETKPMLFLENKTYFMQKNKYQLNKFANFKIARVFNRKQ